ncbi:MAG TPA: hypothetical protein VG433_03115 [Pirellulales bacterium]|jgi:hypothetical protein|nr:hypothetical protein [Pirellulales bacterium]
MSHKRRVIVMMLMSMPCGCGRIAPPYLLHPGTEGYQQARAERFDPYAEEQLGPSNINVDGIRPRGFDKPASEVKRAQTNGDAALEGVDSAEPIP